MVHAYIFGTEVALCMSTLESTTKCISCACAYVLLLTISTYLQYIKDDVYNPFHFGLLRCS